MKLVIVEFNGETKEIIPAGRSLVRLQNTTLGKFLKPEEHNVDAVQINGSFDENWRSYTPKYNDVIHLYIKTSAAIIIPLIVSIVSAVLSYILRATPKKPSTSKSQPASAVAGIQNTVAPGTAKFLTYGRRRVFGHIIASRIDIDENMAPGIGNVMKYSVLYYMGTGPINSIENIIVNETHIEDLSGPPKFNIRLGTQDQSVIQRHEQVHQVYHDNRSIKIPLRTVNKPARPVGGGEPIIYTTRGQGVDRVTFFFRFPQGLWQLGVHGAQYPHQIGIKFERKLNDSSSWDNLGIFNSGTWNTQDDFFWKLEFDNPSSGQWDYKINVESQGLGSWKQGPSMLLYNVQETVFVTTAYPGNALLEINGVANDQIQSLDSMATSAIVEGRLVDVLENGIYVKKYSRNRVWVIRDLLLNKDVGLGNCIDDTMWDNAAGLVSSKYYEELVPGYNNTLEARDSCDVIINEIKPGMDHIKTLLFEGRAILIPSSGVYKYVLDRDRSFNVLYSSPGNIVEGSLKYERGNSERPVNTLRAEYPDETMDYKVIPTKLVSATKGTDPERTETISYTSITRKSNVAREMNFYLKKLILTNERWSWKVPDGVTPSEPFDVDKLQYNLPNNARGFVGRVHGDDSTITSIVTGRNIYLEPDISYTAMVRQGDKHEERIVSNPAGTNSVINVNVPLSFKPKTGDIYAIGKQNVHSQLVQTDEVEFDGEEVTVKVHKHIAEVYDDTLTDISAIENASAVTSAPRPILGVQIKNITESGKLLTRFNVIPGFDTLVGTYKTLTKDYIVLGNEPKQDELFTGAFIETDLTPTPILCTSYAGASRIAYPPSTGFPVQGETSGGQYYITWPGRASFSGFKIEGSTSVNGPWSNEGLVPNAIIGTSLTTSFPIPSSYQYFRITPFSESGTENVIGRHVTGLTSHDERALPPSVVDIVTDDIRNGILIARLNTPLERDVQYLKSEFFLGSVSGTTVTSATLTNISKYRNDLLDIPLIQNVTRNLSSQAFGSNIFGKVSTIDFYGNRSIHTITFTGSVLSKSGSLQTEVVHLDNQVTSTYTGGELHTIFSRAIPGGLIGDVNDVELDLHLLVTPGSVTNTSLSFICRFGGTIAHQFSVQIANGSVMVPENASRWLNMLLESNGNSSSQIVTVHTYGRTSSGIILTPLTTTMSKDATVDQSIVIQMQISGDLTTVVKRRHALLRQLIP